MHHDNFSNKRTFRLHTCNGNFSFLYTVAFIFLVSAYCIPSAFAVGEHEVRNKLSAELSSYNALQKNASLDIEELLEVASSIAMKYQQLSDTGKSKFFKTDS